MASSAADVDPAANPNAAVDLVPSSCMDWRQADVFDVTELLVVDGNGRANPYPCPDGAVLLTQSCDAVRTDRPRVQLSPVVHLADVMSREARSGKRPRYAHLADLGDDVFADLDIVTTVHKARLAEASRVTGVSDDEAVRRFAGAVARKFGRSAFPDEVVACLQPLKSAIAGKAAKVNSPLGRALESVDSLRLSVARGWEAAPYELTLLVILLPGALPDFTDPEVAAAAGATASDLADGGDVARGDFLPRKPPGLEDELREAGRLTPSVIAGRLQRPGEPPDVTYWLWQLLAQAWAEQCDAAAAAAEVEHLVDPLSIELATVDDFPLSRVNSSEALDLDYLSEPLPRPTRPA